MTKHGIIDIFDLMKRIVALDGFIFGSFTQFAIGPLTFIVLNTSIQYGYLSGLAFMSGEIIIDILYMFLACIGVSKLLQKKKLQIIMKLFGVLILFIFGLNLVLSVFGVSIFSIMKFQGNIKTNLFFQGIILTASNPLSILFFGGIFTSKIIENNYTRTDTFIFAAGCVLARVIFVIIIIFLGNMVNSRLNTQVINTLNIIVGIIIIFFGIKLLVKKI